MGKEGTEMGKEGTAWGKEGTLVDTEDMFMMIIGK